MINDIYLDRYLSDDELILMIKKGNEGAMELLFSYYETILRTESAKFRNSFRLPVFSYDDVYQELRIDLFDAVNKYDYHQGKFSSFFLILSKREMLRILKFETKGGNDSRRNEEFNENINYNHQYVGETFKFEEECESLIDKSFNNDDIFSRCIKLWIGGYSYKEISEILNISIPSVNYHIRKSIYSMREKLLFSEKKKKS